MNTPYMINTENGIDFDVSVLGEKVMISLTGDDRLFDYEAKCSSAFKRINQDTVIEMASDLWNKRCRFTKVKLPPLQRVIVLDRYV